MRDGVATEMLLNHYTNFDVQLTDYAVFMFYVTSHSPCVCATTVKLILATSTDAMSLLRRTFPRPALNGLIGRNNPKVFPSRSVGSSEPDLAVLRSANSLRASHRRAKAVRSDAPSSATSRVNRRPYATLLCHSALVETSQPRSALLTSDPEVIGLRPGQMLKAHA